MIRFPWGPPLVLGSLLLTGLPVLAAADDEGDEAPKLADLDNKLTLAYYDFSSDAIGFDINLRHTFSTSTAWLGVRRYFSDRWRLTVDVVREQGTADDGSPVRSWAPSVDIEWQRWFVRAAVDPHVNYTPDRQVRLATGLKF